MYRLFPIPTLNQMLPPDAIVSVAIGVPSILIAFLGLWIAYMALGASRRDRKQVPIARTSTYRESLSLLDPSTFTLPRQPERVYYA